MGRKCFVDLFLLVYKEREGNSERDRGIERVIGIVRER